MPKLIVIKSKYSLDRNCREVISSRWISVLEAVLDDTIFVSQLNRLVKRHVDSENNLKESNGNPRGNPCPDNHDWMRLARSIIYVCV